MSDLDYQALALKQLKPRVNGPMRNVDLEEKIRKELNDLDSLLDIQWVPVGAIFPEGYEGRYGLICRWPQVDKRWSMIQSGEIGEPYDFLGWFTQDVQDINSTPVDIDSISSKVIELLGKCDNTRFPWRERMGQLVEKNAKVKKERQKLVLDRVDNVASTLWQAAGRWDATKVERIMKEASEESYE